MSSIFSNSTKNESIMKEVKDALQSNAVSEFLEEIEKIRAISKTDYMDAVLHYCEKNDLDIDSVAQFIRKNSLLKAKIQEEAEQLNYLEKSAKLPI